MKEPRHAVLRPQCHTLGIDAYPVCVEVDTERTLSTFTVVGLPDWPTPGLYPIPQSPASALRYAP